MLLDRRIRIVYGILLIIIIGLIMPIIISYYLGEYQADLGNCDTPTLNRQVKNQINIAKSSFIMYFTRNSNFCCPGGWRRIPPPPLV